MSDMDKKIDQGKRNLLRKAFILTPAVVAMVAIPSVASACDKHNHPKKPKQPKPRKLKGNEGLGNGYDPAPPGHRGTNYNDYPGTSPGNPGHQHPKGK